MDQAAHASRLAGSAEAGRQAHVDVLELGLAAVQDGDQVDHRIGIAQQPGQGGIVVDVCTGQLHRGQQLQVAGAREAPGGHAHPAAGGARALDQLLAHALADEAGAAEHEQLERCCHGRSFSGGGALGSGGPIVRPRRERTATPLVPSTIA